MCVDYSILDCQASSTEGGGGARGFIPGARSDIYLYKFEKRFFKMVQRAGKCLYRLTNFIYTTGNSRESQVLI